MKKNNIRLLIPATILLLVAALQPLVGQTRLKLSKTDTLLHPLIDLLKESASQVFHDPSPPRYVMIDSPGNFLFGMGGYVSCYAYYDGTGFLSRDMITTIIPMEHSSLHSGRFNLDASNSRIFIQLIGNTSMGYDRPKWHMQLAGVLRFLEKQRGYGLALSGHLYLTRRDVFINSRGDFYKIRALGYYAAWEHHWNDKCFTGLVYSVDHIEPYENTPDYFYRKNHDGRKGYT